MSVENNSGKIQNEDSSTILEKEPRNEPRYITLFILLDIVIAGLINVGTSQLPHSWAPYAWAAWLVLIPFIIITIRLTFQHSAKARLTDKHLNQNRNNLILRVQNDWIKTYLKIMLPSEDKISIALKLRTDTIVRPFDALVQRRHQESNTVYNSSDLYSIFDNCNGSLLILGSPGSGKTALLLDLTDILLELAKQNVDNPIPIIFPLSSFASGYRSLFITLEDWLIRELHRNYRVPPEVAQSLVEHQRIILMLDGFDELDASYQKQCAAAINKYLHKYNLTKIVVCSRYADYQALSEKLELQDCVEILPLTKNQVDAYLKTRNEPMEGIRAMLRDDPILWELLESPFWLNVICETYKDIKPRTLRRTTTIEERRTQILSDFVSERFQSGPQKKPYNDARTVNWLALLACNLTDNSQEIFITEQIQASWLSRRVLRWLYVFVTRMVVSVVFWIILVIAIVLLFACLSPFGVKPNLSNLPSELNMNEAYASLIFFGTFVSLVIGFLGGFGVAVVDMIRLNLKLISTFTSKFSLRIRVLSRCLLIGVISGWLASQPLVGLLVITSQEQGQDLSDNFIWTMAGLFTVMIGVFYSIIFGGDSDRNDLSSDIKIMERLQWSFNLGMKGAWRGFLIGGVVGFLFSILFSIVLDGITNGAEQGITAIFRYGFQSLLVTAPRGVIMFGFIGAIVGIALKGVYRRFVETSLSFNYGIKLSVRNALFAGVIGLLTLLPLLFTGSVVIGAVRLLQLVYYSNTENLYFVGSWLPIQKVDVPSNIFGAALFSTMFFMWYGGRDFLQHYILRLLLIIGKDTPLRFQHFLNYCVKKDFLRKVGGGYKFHHRYLRDYFLNHHNVT